MLILCRVWLSIEKICQSAALPLLFSFVRAHDETKLVVVPAFKQFGLEFGPGKKLKYLPTSPGIGNSIVSASEF